MSNCKSIFLMLCLAWQNLIPPFHRARLGHDDRLSNLNFHTYKVNLKAGYCKPIRIFFCLFK